MNEARKVKWPKADAIYGRDRLHELPDGIEDDAELGLVLLLEGIGFASEVCVRAEELTELHERPHNEDVDLDGAPAIENRGKHGDALFAEGVGGNAAATSAL